MARGEAMLSRRSVVCGLLTAALGASLRPTDAHANRIELVPIESWTRHPLNSHGVPEGWRTYQTPRGRAAYDFTIVEDEGRRALYLRSQGDHSCCFATVKQCAPAGSWNMVWIWKLVQLPEGADLRRRESSDAAPHLFVIWPRRPVIIRSRLIGYVWDPALPVGTVQKSQKTETVTFLIVRSSAAQLGHWLTERRSVVEDYRAVYGEEPEGPGAMLFRGSD